MKKEKARILHVSTTSAGGLGQSILTILRCLDPDRYDIEVALGLGYPLDRAFEESGFTLHGLKLSRGVHPTQFGAAILRLRRLMLLGRYDIVHVHGAEAGVLARIAAWLTEVPVVVTELHGYSNRNPDSILERTIYLWIERLLDRVTDAYVAVSNHVKRQWVDRGVTAAASIQTIHHALDLREFPDRGDGWHAGAHRAPVVGTVCLLEQRKGLEFLVEAMPAVIARVPDVRFQIIGEGPYKERMVARLTQLGIAKHVEFLGWRRDVPQLMWSFDVFALPSLRESFGLVFLEAMAARCPVVASRTDGIPEVVADGETGLLVPPGNAPELADALIQLLTDPGRARQMGNAGRARVERLFSIERMAREYDELYTRLLSRP